MIWGARLSYPQRVELERELVFKRKFPTIMNTVSRNEFNMRPCVILWKCYPEVGERKSNTKDRRMFDLPLYCKGTMDDNQTDLAIKCNGITIIIKGDMSLCKAIILWVSHCCLECHRTRFRSSSELVWKQDSSWKANFPLVREFLVEWDRSQQTRHLNHW